MSKICKPNLFCVLFCRRNTFSEACAYFVLLRNWITHSLIAQLPLCCFLSISIKRSTSKTSLKNTGLLLWRNVIGAHRPDGMETYGQMERIRPGLSSRVLLVAEFLNHCRTSLVSQFQLFFELWNSVFPKDPGCIRSIFDAQNIYIFFPNAR